MVLGAPRSGTAWAANWLTTETSTCIHDPLFRYHYDQLDNIQSQKRVGVSCTGLALYPDFLAHHQATKVILHRPIDEINASLSRISLPPIPQTWARALHSIEGLHVEWTDLFDPKEASRIYERLLGGRFDPERHRELVDLNVQMNFGNIHVNRTETVRLLNDLRKTGENLV